MVDEIISKTKEQAFPTGPVISLENFDSHGGKSGPQTLSDMVALDGKTLQESYRSGWSESEKLVQKVTGR